MVQDQRCMSFLPKQANSKHAKPEGHIDLKEYAVEVVDDPYIAAKLGPRMEPFRLTPKNPKHDTMLLLANSKESLSEWMMALESESSAVIENEEHSDDWDTLERVGCKLSF